MALVSRRKELCFPDVVLTIWVFLLEISVAGSRELRSGQLFMARTRRLLEVSLGMMSLYHKGHKGNQQTNVCCIVCIRCAAFVWCTSPACAHVEEKRGDGRRNRGLLSGNIAHLQEEDV